MSKILEALVARGRRARNPREQKGVALGLAEQSTQKELHDRLYKKGGISALLTLLQSSTDSDAQMLSALAIANCVSTVQCRLTLVQEEVTLLPTLIEYIKDTEKDSQGRNYCAMAVGNLAAEVENHEEIVKFGAIEAVINLLQSYPNNAEAGRFGAFALSNLAANEEYQQKIVDNGAIEILVALACTDFQRTQHWALAALRGICSSPKYRAIAVKQGILDPLVLMARSEHVEVLREVSAAFNCLSSVEENKREMAYRVLSTVMALLLSGDMEVERHACSTIANLIEMIDVHARFIDERGLPPIVALAVTSLDEKCKGEAARVIANLSANGDIQHILIREKAIDPMIEALHSSDVNCKRFAALCIANLATSALSQIKVVQSGAVQSLVRIISESDSPVEAQRYAALAIANLSASLANHQSLISQEGMIDALFSLTNSPDTLSKYYVGCALANFICNMANHEFLVVKGGLQPIIALAYSKDLDTQRQAAAALRGLSATSGINMKIVQEGGLEPLSKILAAEVDNDILQQVTACLCNLSLSDENKYEIAKCGAVSPLIAYMQSDDILLSMQCSACLASLAEIEENQVILFKEGCIQPCIETMRSRCVEVQRESGRLLANMSAGSKAEIIDQVIKEGGHQLLISFLLSQDIMCQRIGAFGTGNLCTQQPYHTLLALCGAVEPLCSLARSEDTDLEIRRFAMLAIANLALSEENHALFIEENVLTMLVSMCNVSDEKMRDYAAYAVANLAKNADIRDAILKEGGIESVLFLSRSLEPEMQHIVIAAIANLSFSAEQKQYICNNGGLSTISATLLSEDVNLAKLACCALANISEVAENLALIVGSGLIEQSLKLLQIHFSPDIVSEAFRALGNISARTENGEIIMKDESILRSVLSSVRQGHDHCESRRMAVMVLSNLAANAKNHSNLLRNHVVEPLLADFRAALDEKGLYDNETVQFGLLTISNLASWHMSHALIVNLFLEMLIRFTRHRDIKCRQYSVLAVGNLCSNHDFFDRLVDSGCMQILISYSFPSASEFSISVRTQAIAGLRGLTTHPIYRLRMMKDSGIEPLILATASSSSGNSIDLQREAAATFRNMALGDESGISMIQNGVLPTLIELSMSNDSECQYHALLGLASLAELENKSQSLMLEAGCLRPLLRVADSCNSRGDVREAAIRCICLFSCSVDSHSFLLRNTVAQRMGGLIRDNEDDVVCHRYVSLAVANFAVLHENHQALFDSTAVAVVLKLAKSSDTETRRSVSFMLHGIAANPRTHSDCIKLGVPKILAALLTHHDLETQIQACLCVRHLCVYPDATQKFIHAQGLPALFALSKSESVELKREVASSLRNISIADQAKNLIAKDDRIHTLAELSRLDDHEVSHQACGVIANLAEAPENQENMVNMGILQHLKYIWRSSSMDVRREVLRAIANIASNASLTNAIINAGAAAMFLAAFTLPDLLCRRFAMMGIANVTTNIDIQELFFEENFLNHIFSIISQHDPEKHDAEALRCAIFSLASFAVSEKNHLQMIKFGIIKFAVNFLKNSDGELRNSAMLCLANLASNPATHDALSNDLPIEDFNHFLRSSDEQFLLVSVHALKGLSVDYKMRLLIINCQILPQLLKLALTTDGELQKEVVGVLCNLSICGCFRDLSLLVLQGSSIATIISFLESDDQMFQLFAALVLGNLASNENLHEAVLQSGALTKIVSAVETANLETQRLLSRALCNLAATESARLSILQFCGLQPIISLASSDNIEDMRVGLSVLRGFAAFPDLRRTLVEAGTLAAIALGLKSDTHCQREAVSCLSALSLNDENKHDIMTCMVKDVLELATRGDQTCSHDVIKIFANLSEDENLHLDIIHNSNGIDRFIQLLKNGNAKVLREVARCFANLASTKSTHSCLLKAGVLTFFAHLCGSQDIFCRRYAAIGLFNLALEVSNIELLTYGNKIVSLLTNIIRDGIIFDLLSCRYAILACGALALSFKSHEGILYSSRNASLLGEMIEAEDHEMNMYCCFALNKLSTSESTLAMMDGGSLIGALATLVDATNNRHVCAHAVSTIRKLCFDPINRMAVMEGGGLKALCALSLKADVDALREVAACFLYISLTKELVSSLVASPVMHSIQIMLMTQDIETLRMALGALANMAEDLASHEKLMADSTTFSVLCSTIKNRSLVVHRETCRVISNFLSCEAAHGLLKVENGLAKLSFLAKSTDSECRLNVALCFRKLASNFSNHDDLMTEGYFQTILELAKCSHVETRRLAAAALLDLSHNEIHKCHIAQRDGLKTAIDLMANDDFVATVCAVQILRQFSLSNRLKTVMVQENVTEGVLKCISKTDQVVLVQQCTTVLVNLSSHPENHCKLVDRGLTEPLVELAYHGDFHVRNDVASILCFLSSHPKHRNGVFNVQHFKAMLHLLSFKNNDCSWLAALAFGNLVESEGNIKLIITLEGVVPLVALLQQDVSEKCRSASSRVIRKIALLEKGRSCIIEADSISNLLRNIQYASVDVQAEASMALCNLATSPIAHDIVAKTDGIRPLVAMLSNPDKRCRKLSSMSICNYSKLPKSQLDIVQLGGILPLINSTKSDDKDCAKYATLALCNLSANRENRVCLIHEGILDTLPKLLDAYTNIEVHRALAAIVYNLTSSVACHDDMVNASVLPIIHATCKASDVICKRYALMSMCNLSSNSIIRKSVTSSGGLHSSITLLDSEDMDTKLYACACLANMSNNSVTQSMIVVHGGLPALMNLASSASAELQRGAIVCLGNIAANQSNHAAMLRQGAFELLVKMFDSTIISVREASSFALSNFTVNMSALNIIGKRGGIIPLLYLIISHNSYIRCLASSAMRCLSCDQENWDLMCQNETLQSIVFCGNSDDIEIKRNVAACFCNLSLGEANRMVITTHSIKQIVSLSQVEDDECRRQSIGAIANLVESEETHQLVAGCLNIKGLIGLPREKNIDVSREILRALSNLLTSIIFQEDAVAVEELASVFDLVTSEDPECQYHVSLCLRKLSLNTLFHQVIVQSGLMSLFALLKVRDYKTKKHAATAFRNLCAGEMFKEYIAHEGGIDAALSLAKMSKNELQLLGFSSLRHLSTNSNLKRVIVDKGALDPCVSYSSWASDGLQRQIAGLLANLSEHGGNQADMVAHGVTQSVLSLVRHKNSEVVQDCSRTLANLCTSDQNQVAVYRHGALDCLISLASGTDDDICQRYLALGIRFLVANPEVRRNILSGHTILSFREMAASNVVDYKRAVAASFASLSLEPDSRVTLAKTFGIEDILQLCEHDDLQTKRDAVFTTANLADTREIQDIIIKQGGIIVLHQASCKSCDIKIRRDASRAFSCLINSPEAQEEVLKNGILQSIYNFSQSADLFTQRFAVLTLCNMSFSNKKVDLVENGILAPLLFLVRFPDLEIERCAALAMAGLALGSFGSNKLRLMQGGGLSPLLSMIKFPDEELQHCCTLALNCMALSDIDEIKLQLIKDDSIDSLLGLLKTRGDEGILGCLYLLGSMAENDEVRASLVGLGCILAVVNTVNTENIEIKRAAGYFLALLAEQSDNHKELQKHGALEAIINITSTADSECQEYGSFALVYLSGNRDYQLQLARMGAVRPCVSLMATNAESKHYAALALLKLADNFENHLIIAEQGGIQALLRLGRSRVVNEEVHYRAAMTVGNLASNAMKTMDKRTAEPS